MPDQPEDPLHYEMKIPPEPKTKKEDEGAPESEQESTESATAKDINVPRGDDKPQSVRHSG